MTDNEIIKALECCGEMHECYICPRYDRNNDLCREYLRKDVLDLINRQKAEIEKLKADVKRLTSENENLTTVKAEAIKEFAGRLISMCDKPHWCVWMSEIEDLVEEMTGEQI